MKDLSLSAGQLQLLSLAHALLRRDCPLILFDEATSNVDIRTNNALRAAILTA
jgi:ABC-type multidrug transport system fused ATPase/permease subunit